jgi:hypothetical protein
VHSRTGSTPHSRIFTFHPSINPGLKRSRPIEKVEYGKINVSNEELVEEHPIAGIAILQQEGDNKSQ